MAPDKNSSFSFRQAALAAHHRENVGETLTSRPISLRIASVTAIILVSALIIFALEVSYTRKERVNGYLTPDRGIIKVVAPLSGTVRESRVSPSSEVKSGEALFIINAERTSGGSTVESTTIGLLQRRKSSLIAEKAKQSSIDSGQLNELKRQRKQLMSEIALLEEQIAIQDEQISNSTKALSRAKELVAAKYFSESQLDQHRSALLSHQARRKELAKSIVNLERELGTLDERIASISSVFDVQRFSKDRQIDELDQQIADYEGRKDLTVTAPISGKVSGILLNEGEAVEPGTVLMSIIPSESELEALVFVPARAAGFIRVGQEVSLRYQAYPFQNYGSFKGKISNIDRTILAGSDVALPYPLKEPSYRVRVALKEQSVRIFGEEISLQPGAQFEADIAVDRRRLIDWLFDPIYSVTGKM